MIQRIAIAAKIYPIAPSSKILATILTSLDSSSSFPDTATVISSVSQVSTSSIPNEASPVSVDALSSDDILVGIIIALVLAFITSFLQSRRAQNDFVLWEDIKTQESTNELIVNNTVSSSRAFDADSWKEMSRPDNYILYNRKVRGFDKKEKTRNTGSTQQVVEQRVVVLALLVLFVPIFSVEFFFALSRQLICETGDGLVQSDWAELLCSPARVTSQLSFPL